MPIEISPAIEDDILEKLRESVSDDTSHGTNYRVILYNDQWHTQEEVVFQLQKATACSLREAAQIMLEAHRKGRAICFRGEREECQRVVKILREIRLQCEVDCD